MPLSAGILESIKDRGACVEITAVDPNGGDITVTCPSAGAGTAWFYTDQQP